MSHKPGDTIIKDGKTFRYVSYDVWAEVTDRTQVVSPDGLTASVVENTENSQNELQVRSVLSAKKPGGTFVDIEATRGESLKVSMEGIGDLPGIDSFGRFRVSQPYTIFDSKQLHDKQPLFWDEIVSGAATSTHNSDNASTEMVVTANVADHVIRQTKQRATYQPGKTLLSFFTFTMPTSAGVTKRVGLFDGTGVDFLTPNNGVFIQNDGAVSWNIAKNGVVTETVLQSGWNVDKFDGTGVSGVTLDMSAAQIAIIDYEWLGVGRVRVGFVINGLICYCHYFNHANTLPNVYMSTPNLSVRYDIKSTGGAGQLDHICSTIIIEGGIEHTGVLRSVDTGSTHLDANTIGTTYAVLGVRQLHRDIIIYPEYFSMIDEAGGGFRWSLQLNPTVAGTFAYVDITNSSVQKAVGVTANTITTEGLVMDSGYVAPGGAGAGVGAERKFVTSLKMGSKIDGTTDTLVLCVTPLTANEDIQASLTLMELL